MSGINRVILIGNLGADPETRFTQAGSPVTNFRIATSEKWKDKQTGQQQERTEWHQCCAFGRLAEIAGEYLRKGSKVYVEGSLRTSSWESDGQTRYKIQIICNEMQMLDGKPAVAQGRQTEPDHSNGSQHHHQPAAAPQRQPVHASALNDFDDDIPF